MFSRRLTILISLMIAELGLVWLLRSVHIDRLTESTRWWITLLAALLPLLSAVAVLFRNGLRIRLRSVMYATALLAVFLSVIVAPVSKERRIRRGAAILDAAGVTVHDALETDEGEVSVPLTTDRSRILDWMTPVLGNIDRLPTDVQVRHATLRNDEHVEILLEHLDDFPNLVALSIYRTGVTDAAIDNLRSNLRNRQLKELYIFGVDGSYVDWLKAHPSLRCVYLVTAPPTMARAMHANEVHELAKLSNLKRLVISHHKMTEKQLADLGQLQNLRSLQLHFVDVPKSAIDALKQARPDCEFVVVP